MAVWRRCSFWPTGRPSAGLGLPRRSGSVDRSREIELNDSFERFSVVIRLRLGLTWSWCPSANCSTPVWLPLRANTVTTSNEVSAALGNPASDPRRWQPRAALALLRGYKLLISPYFAGSCRFVPVVRRLRSRRRPPARSDSEEAGSPSEDSSRCQPLCAGGSRPGAEQVDGKTRPRGNLSLVPGAVRLPGALRSAEAGSGRRPAGSNRHVREAPPARGDSQARAGRSAYAGNAFGCASARARRASATSGSTRRISSPCSQTEAHG